MTFPGIRIQVEWCVIFSKMSLKAHYRIFGSFQTRRIPDVLYDQVPFRHMVSRCVSLLGLSTDPGYQASSHFFGTYFFFVV